MAQENHQDRLRLGRNAWLAIIILAIALCATTTQSASARRHSMEIPDAAIHRDLVYKRINGRELKLDLDCPQNASGPSPVILWIHAAGWRRGRKEQHIPIISFRSDGYAVASLELRLSGEAPFPAQIEDCKAAVRWLRANAANYNLDVDRIGAVGHSAGGHSLAAWHLSPGYRSWRAVGITRLIRAACKRSAMRPARQIFCVSTTTHRIGRAGQGPKPYLPSMRSWAGRPSKIKRKRSRQAQLPMFRKMIRLFSSSTGRMILGCLPAKASY